MRYDQLRRNDALRHYHALALASRLDAATPHQLVGYLYEELGQALAVAMAVLDRGESLVGEPNALRARSILVALAAGLDRERGGSLASTLGDVYRSMLKALASAIEQSDRAGIEELAAGVDALAESWKKIAA